MKILQRCLISMIIAAGMVVNAASVVSAGSSKNSYIIVHCYNPEGKEINSIEGVGDCAAIIYDGNEFLVYSAKDIQTYKKPIAMTAGAHKIRVTFNGMELAKDVNLNKGETQELTFIFERVEQHTKIKDIFDSQGLDTIYADIRYPNDGYAKEWKEKFMTIYLFRESNAMYFKVKAEASLSSSLFRVEGFVEDIYYQWNKLYSVALTEWRVDYNNIIEGTADFTNWFYQGYYGGDKKRCSNIYIKAASGGDIDLTPPYNENPAYFLRTTDASQSYNSVYGYPRFPGSLEIYSVYPYYRFLLSGYLYYGDYEEVSAPIELDLNFNTMKFSSVPYDLLETAVGEARPVASIKTISPSPARPEEAVTMQGEGRDSDGQITAYSWRSSIDGQLSDQASFSTAGLSEGKHKIYFKVMDNAGIWSEEASKRLYIGLTDSSSDTTHGESKDGENSEGEPVNIVTGNMYTIEEDIAIPGRGIGLNYSRCYNSHKVYQGGIGYGWTHSYNVLLEEMEDDGQVRIMLEDGQAVYFTRKQDGSYIPPAGEHSSLSKAEDKYIWRQKDGIKYYFDLAGKLSAITDRNNNRISLSYNTDGLLSSVSDSTGRQITFAYNSENRVSEVSDPAGNKVKYSYDTNGNLTRVTDLRGKDTVYEYNSEHNIVKITDAKGSQLHFEYDSQDRCIANYRDNDLLRVNLSYAPANRKTTISDSLGRQKIKTYNQDGLVTQVQEADGKSVYYTWDADQNRTSVKDKNGNLTQMSYDSLGNLLSITDAQNNTTNYEYEPNYNFITKTTDSQGKSTIYSYDSSGNQTSITNALGEETRYSYDNSGQIIRVEDAKGNSTSYEYDNYGNLTLTIDALGNQTRSSCDIRGSRTSITDAQGNTTNYEYDPAGNLTGITYPDTTQVKITYDETGNRSSITDANGNTSRFEYTPTDKLAKSVDALGRQVSYIYDSEENLTEVTDAKGSSTRYSYDKLDRLIKEENALGIITSYEYDAAGNKIAGSDGKGQVIRYEYDNLNRMIKKVYPDGKTISYKYDSLSRVIEINEVRGEKGEGRINYRYDTLNRITRIESLQSGKTSTINYEYDALGNRVKMVDQDGGESQYEYTALNQLKSLINPQNQQTSFIYNEMGNLDSVVYTNGIRIEYSFDKMQRLEKIENKTSTGQVLSDYSYTYDPAGRRIKSSFICQVKYPTPEVEYKSVNLNTSGVNLSMVETLSGEVIYTYDNANQLIEEQSCGTGNNYNISYNYDAAGNRVRMIKNGQVTDYSYNAYNQLLDQTNSSYSGGNKVLISGETAAEDISRVLINGMPVELKAGKFSVQVAMMPGENTIRAQAYDRAGNLSEVTRKINLNPSIEAAYSYDNNGNRIQKSYRGEQTVYSYDYDNQLVEIDYPSGAKTEYGYDSEGRRRSEERRGKIEEGRETTEDGGGKREEGEKKIEDGREMMDDGRRTDYFYDGNTVIIERDQTGKTTAAYTRGVSMGGGIGSLISVRKEGQDYYYLYDGQGNIIQLTDSTGKVIISYEYDAFGNITRQDGSLSGLSDLQGDSFGSAQGENNYQFQTKEFDSDSGLIYFGARYYDPKLGRWLTPDPLGMPDGPNTYLYLNNNPLGFIDPWGLCKEKKKYPIKKGWRICPRYGNWGGLDWSGGQEIRKREIGPLNVPAQDSMDALFKKHDISSWDAYKQRDKQKRYQVDKELYYELIGLPEDPRNWEMPAPDVEEAIRYKKDAEWWFGDVMGANRNMI